MTEQKITCAVTIGTEGASCWLCSHGPASGPRCELFDKRRVLKTEGGAWQRVPECVEAERKTKEEGHGPEHR